MDGQRFTVSPGEGPLGGYVLSDHRAGSSARVIPEAGANCVQFSVPGPAGDTIELFRAPASADELRSSPSRSGIPLLFPFPNRVRGGRYTFNGETYQLRVNSQENAIHGLVIAARFLVEAAEATPDGAHLRCVVAHADLADTTGYPFPFRFMLDFTLSGTTLTLTATATNEGEGPMPMGFGIHPYFRIPMTESGNRENCLVQAPVQQQWELEQTLVPTGRSLPSQSATALRALAPMGSRTFDDVYGGLIMQDGWSTCRLVDPAVPLEVAVAADATFREVVVYAPPGQGVVCFEPYTCATDAFNLNERGIDAGRIVLEAGERWVGTVRIAATVG